MAAGDKILLFSSREIEIEGGSRVGEEVVEGRSQEEEGFRGSCWSAENFYEESFSILEDLEGREAFNDRESSMTGCSLASRGGGSIDDEAKPLISSLVQ